jgi:hypothetical protein
LDGFVQFLHFLQPRAGPHSRRAPSEAGVWEFFYSKASVRKDALALGLLHLSDPTLALRIDAAGSAE